jgi:DNA-binding response OmpR family regulator
MHALIIEDEALVGLAIEDVLRDNGCTSFDFASSFDAALVAAEIRCPDLITADVRLAPGNGIDAVQSICGGGKAIPVIFITGTGSEVRERFPGMVVIDKPFAVAQVAAAVRAAISTLR